MKRHSCAAGMLLMLAACAAPPPEQQLLVDTAQALGGSDRVRAARALVLEGQGVHYYLGQDVRPHASGQTFTVSDYRRVIDVGQRRARTELTRTPTFLYFQGQQPQRQVQGIDGEIAYNVAASGNASRANDALSQERQIEFYHHPLTLVQAALTPGTTIAISAPQRTARITLGGRHFDLTVDAQGLPLRIASPTAHPNLGDIVVTTEFAEYRDVEGLRLPSQITTKIDDFTTGQITVAAQRLNETVDVAAPAPAASAPVPPPPTPNVVAEDVAPGVWRLAGQSHHSALIEFRDYLLLIDAPQSEARALAVIAKAREMRPGKPLTTLVTTHHHFDHSAGFRAAVAEGLSVVTHQDNKAFFEEMARRPHTIVPDALAKSQKPLNIETVADQKTIEDGSRRLVLYHVPGHQHSETMLVAYLPQERVLIEVDTFIPNVPSNPYIVGSAKTMVELVKKLGIRVDRIVPLHFTIEPYDLMIKAMGETR